MINEKELEQARKRVQEYTDYYNSLSIADLEKLLCEAGEMSTSHQAAIIAQLFVAAAAAVIGLKSPSKMIERWCFEMTKKRFVKPHKLIYCNRTIPYEIEDLAEIAKAVYHSENKFDWVNKWENVTSDGRYSNIPFIHQQSGLVSALYKKTNNNKESEFVYAFAGTDFTCWKDIKTDVEQIYCRNEQYERALSNANEISYKLGNNKLTFVGHSKGGGEAAYCALHVDGRKRRAVTFNPAGVNKNFKDVEKANENIDAYILMTDPLNIIQDMELGGVPQADGIKHYIHFHPQLNGHRIISVIDGINKYKSE